MKHFSYNLHLRTPLSAILVFSQLLAHSANLDPEQRNNLKTLRNSGEHLLSLINQVLDLSKMEAGRITLDETVFNLGHLLDETEELFRMRAKNKGLALLFERAPDMPRYVRTDAVKLRQVLINLLGNTVKFTQKGAISMRVGAVAPTCLQFEISDTGPGIAPDELNQLFEAFVQTETGRQSRKGTGLGLAISRKFVELMGGVISVASELGRGSTFTFQIQVGRVDAAAKKNMKENLLALKKLNALPQELTEALKIAVQRTDAKGSHQAIDRIRELDEPLADALADFVGKYRFDLILELFK